MYTELSFTAAFLCTQQLVVYLFFLNPKDKPREKRVKQLILSKFYLKIFFWEGGRKGG